MATWIIEDWTGQRCWPDKEFSSFQEAWGFIYVADPEPPEDSPLWLDHWFDDYCVVGVGVWAHR